MFGPAPPNISSSGGKPLNIQFWFDENLAATQVVSDRATGKAGGLIAVFGQNGRTSCGTMVVTQLMVVLIQQTAQYSVLGRKLVAKSSRPKTFVVSRQTLMTFHC